MLKWNPQKRPSAQQSLRYPFFQVGQNIHRSRTSAKPLNNANSTYISKPVGRQNSSLEKVSLLGKMIKEKSNKGGNGNVAKGNLTDIAKLHKENTQGDSMFKVSIPENFNSENDRYDNPLREPKTRESAKEKSEKPLWEPKNRESTKEKHEKPLWEPKQVEPLNQSGNSRRRWLQENQKQASSNKDSIDEFDAILEGLDGSKANFTQPTKRVRCSNFVTFSILLDMNFRNLDINFKF